MNCIKIGKKKGNFQWRSSGSPVQKNDSIIDMPETIMLRNEVCIW